MGKRGRCLTLKGRSAQNIYVTIPFSEPDLGKIRSANNTARVVPYGSLQGSTIHLHLMDKRRATVCRVLHPDSPTEVLRDGSQESHWNQTVPSSLWSCLSIRENHRVLLTNLEPKT